MKLFPQHSADIPDAKSCYSCEDSCRDDDAEEIPQSFDELAARELIREETPCERRGTNESREESNVCSKVFYRRSTEVVELGENRRRPLEMVLNLLRA